MNLKISATGDGSPTLYNADMEEHYHSVHGALSESKHVFINSGTDSFVKKTAVGSLAILEVGFGTGLNAILTMIYGKNHNLLIDYMAYDIIALDYETITKLKYNPVFTSESNHSAFLRMHKTSWGKSHEITPGFFLKKVIGKIENAELPPDTFDVVYYDAFSPGVQPELWTESVFEKIFSTMKKQGILVTYSAKGAVKRALAGAGFQVEILSGPPGKRHMISATKPT